jgi:hypothetical protein
MLRCPARPARFICQHPLYRTTVTTTIAGPTMLAAVPCQVCHSLRATEADADGKWSHMASTDWRIARGRLAQT